MAKYNRNNCDYCSCFCFVIREFNAEENKNKTEVFYFKSLADMKSAIKLYFNDSSYRIIKIERRVRRLAWGEKRLPFENYCLCEDNDWNKRNSEKISEFLAKQKVGISVPHEAKIIRCI